MKNAYYPHLFEPFTIKKTRFKNRLISSPHAVSWIGADGRPNAEHIAFYEAKARGGMGMVSVPGADVFSDRFFQQQNSLVLNRKTIQHFNELTRALHRHGAVACLQICHAGAYYPPTLDGKNPVAPSAFTRWDGQEVDEITPEEMREIAEGFADYAAFAQEAGFDVVQVHGGHGWLLSQFLAEDINHRTDAFGGSMENRARFPLMVIEAIRERTGPDLLIEYRISGDEFWPGGYTLDDCIAFCKLIDGKVDLIHVSAARDYEDEGCVRTTPTIYLENGCNAYLAAAIRKEVSTPVVAIGAINTPDLAEQILAEGQADFVAMARATIADPDFANKAKRGRAEDIRCCTRCINCLTGMQKNSVLECSVNPTVAREISTALFPKPVRRERVVVIGGGPGGMQAAITASERGHEVILLEQKDHLGGILEFTDHDVLKRDLHRFKNYLVTQVKKRDIDLRLETEADVDSVLALQPDTVIVATGSSPVRPGIPGLSEHARHVLDVKDTSELGRTVAIIGGGLAGCETGVALAMEGHKVHVVEMMDAIARDANWMQPVGMQVPIAQYGIGIHTGTQCLEVTERGLRVKGPDGEETFIEADSVLYAVGMRAENALYEELREVFEEVYAVGDCSRPRQVNQAVHEAYFAAMDIGLYA